MKKLILIFLLCPALLFAGKCVEGDCQNGTGYVEYLDGSKYEGQFKNGLPHGKGVLYEFHTWCHEGTFKKGHMHGWVTSHNAETGRMYKRLYRMGVRVKK